MKRIEDTILCSICIISERWQATELREFHCHGWSELLKSLFGLSW
jgi:hypothetical protein